MSRDTVRIAGVQIPCTESIADNASKVVESIQWAGSEGAQFLITPEMVVTGYHNRWSRDEADAAHERIAEACREVGVCGLIGSGEWIDGKCYNQARVYSPDGECLGAHAKTILTTGDEEQFAPGEELRTWTVGGLTFGCLICNDYWCNPTCTEIPDGKLPARLGELGAQVIFHAIASGPDLRHSQFHIGNLILRAKHAGVVVATANLARDSGVNCPSGVLAPSGEWICQAPIDGEQRYCCDVALPG
ncbi:MAG TPA: carbon-nitrogen hydrolase family protein [Armatimonadota bacterium]|nr:carbon-nitrogen hydrolase family protein [Armatimonadota bacterium]